MKIERMVTGVIFFMIIASTSSVALAERAKASIIYYYADAAKTQLVGVLEYACAGSQQVQGNTSTPYHEVIASVSCGDPSNAPPSVYCTPTGAVGENGMQIVECS